MSNHDWMDNAVCAQTDPEIFFPEIGGNYSDARQVCATCPVTRQCLNYAQTLERGLAYSYRSGGWAGTTPRQRAEAAEQNVAEFRTAQIRQYASRGWSSNDIARALECSTRTVDRILADRDQLGEAA